MRTYAQNFDGEKLLAINILILLLNINIIALHKIQIQFIVMTFLHLFFS